MITRIVKMKFQQEKVQDFKTLFKAQHLKIKSFPGCQKVVLYQDLHEREIFFTYSHWDSKRALNDYRSSELFKSIWKSTKALFSEPANAWSLDEIKVD
jgi:quinol monooxygenase YgiN